MFIDEFSLFTQVIMPFLKERWDEIDVDDGAVSHRDGRLTKVELEAAQERFRVAGDEKAVEIIGELIFRYDAICAAFEDSSGEADESTAGISREDISVYAKLWDPEYRRREGKPNPDNWMNPDDKPEQYWK